MQVFKHDYFHPMKILFFRESNVILF